MKRILSLLLLIFCVVLSVTACSDADNESSETVLSGKTSPDSSQNDKPWYGTSTPDDYSSQWSNTSSAVSSDIGESSVDVSDVTSEEASSESDDMTGAILDVEGVVTNFPERPATSYRIAYTKESALQATDCISNVAMEVPITAVYDGKVTRFFHATKGTFYHAVPGKYLYPCCNGFLSGDLNSFNGNYAVMFEFDEEGNATVSNEHFGHGGFDNAYDFYCEADGCTYLWIPGVDGDFLAPYLEGNLVICREYLGEQNVTSAFKNNEFDLEHGDLGKYGLVKNDTIIIPFEYDYMVTVYGDADSPANNVGVVLAQKDGRSYYFSTDGTNLTPDGFDCGAQPFNNRAWVYENGQGYIIEFR